MVFFFTPLAVVNFRPYNDMSIGVRINIIYYHTFRGINDYIEIVTVSCNETT